MPARSPQRERSGYPPFGRLASLIISAGDRPTAESFARKLASIAPIDERIQVLGPAEAPLAVIKGRYRFRLLVKSLRNVDLSDYLARMAGGGSEDQGQSQARGRRRSAELFVAVIPGAQREDAKRRSNPAFCAQRWIRFASLQ